MAARFVHQCGFSRGAMDSRRGRGGAAAGDPSPPVRMRSAGAVSCVDCAGHCGRGALCAGVPLNARLSAARLPRAGRNPPRAAGAPAGVLGISSGAGGAGSPGALSRSGAPRHAGAYTRCSSDTDLCGGYRGKPYQRAEFPPAGGIPHTALFPSHARAD